MRTINTRGLLFQCVFSGLSLAIFASPIANADSKTLFQTGKTVELEADGSIVVTERGMIPNGSGAFDDQRLIQDALDAVAKQHPGTPQNSVTWVVHEPGGVAVATIRSSDADPIVQTTPPPGEPPAMPHAPGPRDAPPTASSVSFHQNQNGYTRDTRFDRNVTSDGQGGYADSDWWVGFDHIDYVGDGGAGGGGHCNGTPVECPSVQ